jgi:carbon-monoxide dehydrogenase medium subunit
MARDPGGEDVIPAAFDYEVAESVEHALALLGDDPDAKVLAGGHSLVPALKLRIARPSKLVDIGRLSDLAYVRDVGTQIAVGALSTHAAVQHDPLLHEHCPIVSTTAGGIGDPQVRHRGTIGGSLAHGDPASDLPAVMLALDAEFVIVGSGGERTVGAADFFTGVFMTAVGPDELLTEIRIPKLGASTGWSYLKYHRRAQDWATVGVAALVDRDNGTAKGASVALTNMGGTPLRAKAVEDAIGSGSSPADAAAHAAEGTEPSSDTAASAEFRMHLAKVLTQRALTEALV